MRLIVKVLLAALIGLLGYIFWPSSSSLSCFDPASMADRQLAAQRHADAGKNLQAIFDFYGILHGEYRIPPLPAVSAAFDRLRARRAFVQAADQADEEQALPFLESAISIIGEKTGTALDPKIIARLELFEWSLARDRSKERQLAAAISEKLALLYGGAANDYQAIAASFAIARRLAANQNWSNAEEAEAAAWKKLAERIAKPTPGPARE